MNKVADILLSKGADLTMKDDQERTPFALCLEKENIDLLSKLIENVSLNKQSEILHAFTSQILNIKYQEILLELLKNDKPTKETMNVLDNQGLSPFLAYIDRFVNNY
jgi:ankyrin repeat protein